MSVLPGIPGQLERLETGEGALSAATVDEHRGDTMTEHRFVNVLSSSRPSL